MTENEIIETHIAECLHRIEVIENFMHSNSDADKEVCEKNIKVLTTISGLLQEIQAYRAIGTVEDLQNVTTLCESLQEACELGDKLIEEVKKYREIGTPEECSVAVARMKPKKAILSEIQDVMHV